MQDITEKCRGRWTELLRACGIGDNFLTGKHGPCPMCGGKDRFRYANIEGRGTWICNQCSNGRYEDGFEFLKAFRGWSFKECVEELEKIVGSVRREQVKTRRDDARLLEEFRRLWDQGVEVTAYDPVGKYLANRGLDLPRYPDCLRYVPNLKYNQGTEHRFDAMIAAMRSNDGELKQIHKTFLTPEGQKVDLDKAKQYHYGRKPKGASVQIGRPRLVGEYVCLGVAEGIETALTCAMEHKMPVWACGDAPQLMTFNPPPDVQELYIFADNDHNFTGHSAAYALANRLAIQSEGLHIVVSVPPVPGTDWNDVAVKALQRGAAE